MAQATAEHGIRWEDKTLLDSNYEDDSSVLDQKINNMNEFWR